VIKGACPCPCPSPTPSALLPLYSVPRISGMERHHAEMAEEKDGKEKQGNHGERFTVLDFLLELLCWIPEVLIFPFRMVAWLLRGIGKLIGEM
jgi:hypothetical protein